LEREFQEEMRMPYITSLERDAKEEGLQQGLRRGLQRGSVQTARIAVLDALELRFGPVAPAVRTAIEAIDDPERLRDLHKRAITVPALTDLEEILRAGRESS
jgi:hypothetical protein